MAGQQFQIRGDTRANVELATPAARELGVVTDKNELVIGDGATAGGLPQQRKNYAESLAPAQIVADTNNYAPASYDRHCGALVLNTDAKRRITGLTGGSTNRVLFIVNAGTQQIVLSDADAASTAANRFDLGGDLTLLPKGGIKLFYNATASRWQRTSGGNKFSTIPEEFLLTGVISPAQITADQNDYAPTSITLATTLRLNTDASRNVTGIADARDGAIKFINNVGANPIVLKNENAGSAAANRFSFGADVTLAAKQGAFVRYDATDSRWKMISNTAGAAVGAGAVIAASLASSAIAHGAIVNGYLEWTVAGSALTVALKTLNGTDPTAADPALVWVRNTTAAPAAGTPTYTLMTITAALNVVVSSGSSLGTVNATAFRIWAVLFNDAGTARIGVINCLSGQDIYPLAAWAIASSTAEGGAGAADNPLTFYTGTAVAAKSYAVLGYASWESGLAAAGTWSATPDREQVFGPGVPLPGYSIGNQARSDDGTFATGATVIPEDNTIPQNTEGTQFLSKAIVPISAANLLRVRASVALGIAAANECIGAIFRDSAANALKVGGAYSGASTICKIVFDFLVLATATASTTFKLRGGIGAAGTVNFNGYAGSGEFGGTHNSFIEIEEIMT